MRKEAEEVEVESEVRRKYTQVEPELRGWLALRRQPRQGTSRVRPLLPKGQDAAKHKIPGSHSQTVGNLNPNIPFTGT